MNVPFSVPNAFLVRAQSSGNESFANESSSYTEARETARQAAAVASTRFSEIPPSNQDKKMRSLTSQKSLALQWDIYRKNM